MNQLVHPAEFDINAANMHRARHIDEPPRVIHRDIDVRFSVPADLPRAEEFILKQFPCGLGPFSSLAEIALHDPQTLLVFEHKGELVGGKAMLFLNAFGLMALRNGELSLHIPGLEYLVQKDERPAAIYVRLFIASGRGKLALSHLHRVFSSERLRTADLYSRAATPEGIRLVRDWSYEPDPDAKIPLLISRRRQT